MLLNVSGACSVRTRTLKGFLHTGCFTIWKIKTQVEFQLFCSVVNTWWALRIAEDVKCLEFRGAGFKMDRKIACLCSAGRGSETMPLKLGPEPMGQDSHLAKPRLELEPPVF